MTRSTIASIAVIGLVLVTLLWLSRDRLMPGASREQASEKPAAAVSGSVTSSLFTSRPIGNPPRGEERPQIAHVAIVDLRSRRPQRPRIGQSFHHEGHEDLEDHKEDLFSSCSS